MDLASGLLLIAVWQGYLALESGGPRLKLRRLRAICCIQICQVALNAFFDLLLALVDLGVTRSFLRGNQQINIHLNASPSSVREIKNEEKSSKINLARFTPSVTQ